MREFAIIFFVGAGLYFGISSYIVEDVNRSQYLMTLSTIYDVGALLLLSQKKDDRDKENL